MANEVLETHLLGLIVLFPALGALLWGTVGRWLPRRVVGGGATLAIAVPWLLGVVAISGMVDAGGESHGHAVYPTLVQHLWSWFGAGSLSIDFALALDPLSAVLLMIITGVGSLIHLYSMSYMADDASYARYFAYLNLFVAAMLVLVLADNLVLLFLGWEGVGVASYLLIGFWFSDAAKATAGKKAFITNRVGDLAFLLAMFLLFQLSGAFDFASLREWASHLSASQISVAGSMTSFGWLLTIIGVLFFIGCSGKSAQLPLHVWLPDAMAGPTPVSALIHAATMVTAGVYLIARLGFLFSLAPWALALVALVGALTALVAALIATVQTDIKKVLAYSTVSQLGFMFLAVGSGSYFAGVFHLMTHAFFKALLFLGAGAVIHALHGEQDIRKMGGLRAHLPVVRATFLIGCLAIAGFPFVTSGFYSKDEILWFALSNSNLLGGPSTGALWGWGLWAMATATAGLTAFYMFRLYFLVFEAPTKLDGEAISHIHAPGWEMNVPLVVLAILSVVGGFVAVPYALGGPIGGPFLDMHGWLWSVVHPGEAVFSNRLASGGLVYLSMTAAIAAALAGMFVAFRLYAKPSDVPAALAGRLGKLHTLIENRFYFDELYDATLGRGLRLGGLLLHRGVDDLAIQAGLIGTVSHGARLVGSVLRQLHNGDVQRYAALTVMALAVVIYLLVR